MTEITYTEARKEDLPEIARVISIAMAPTPNSIALLGGGGESHQRRLEKTLLIAHFPNPHARTIVAWRGDRIVGAHSMLPWPHCQPNILEGLWLTPQILPLMRGATWRGIRLQAVATRLDPPKPHWHLGPIGVLPEERGSGIGRELVVRALVNFDREQIPAYLETDQPNVVHAEEQLGFKVMAEAEILGVHNWLMWRSPQQP
jgi:GNAT superfamily N-acetyltransferase